MMSLQDRSLSLGKRPIVPTSDLLPYGNPLLWFRADTGITLVSDKVSQWEDVRGNGTILTQSAEANRPELLTLANGKTMMSLNGSQWMEVAGAIPAIWGDAIRNVGRVTFFFVVRSGSNCRYLSWSTTGSTTGRCQPGQTSTQYLYNGRRLDAGSGTSFTLSFGRNNGVKARIASITADYTNGVAFGEENGLSRGSSDMASALGTGNTSNTASVRIRFGITISGGSPVIGEIGEWLMYKDDVLTAAQMAQTNSYLLRNWQ